VINRRRTVGRLMVVLAVVGLAAIGCASSGWPKFVGQDELKNLAGTWQGGLIGQTGGLLPMLVTLTTDGTYVITAETYSSRGTASVREGQLVLYAAAPGGGQSPEQSSAATLSQRDDGVLVLTGSGRNQAGPFAFVITRQK
jgi:hypothetical protein